MIWCQYLLVILKSSRQRQGGSCYCLCACFFVTCKNGVHNKEENNSGCCIQVLHQVGGNFCLCVIGALWGPITMWLGFVTTEGQEAKAFVAW